MAFQIPLHFEDLTRSSVEQWRLRPVPPRESSANELLDQIRELPSAIVTSSSPPSPQFTALFTLVSRYSSLTKSDRTALVDFIDPLVDAVTPSDPAQVKIAAYFIAGLAVTASAVSPVCKFWEKTGREAVLEAISRLASSVPSPSPFGHADLDQLCGLLIRMTLQVLEQPTAARDKNTRAVLARCLATALTLDPKQNLPAITALLHALNRHEHLPAPLAEILFKMTEEKSLLVQFVSEFVREIARLSSDDLARDVTAAKGCASFISELSERNPDVFRSNLALVLSQLDGDSYTMRNGVMHVIGTLIRAAPNAEDPLLDVLMERSHRDIHAFTRSKALQTWISLVEARVVPNRLFPVLADMAASRLDDKTAAVRKYATQLLGALLHNNPFGPALHKSHFEVKLAAVRGDEPGEAEANAEEPETLKSDEPQDEDSQESREEDLDDADKENDPAPDNEIECTNFEKEAESEGMNLEKEIQQGVRGSPEQNSEEPEKEEWQSSLKKKYYSWAVAFIQAVETGLETVYNMLRSKSITDVSEAVSFLITAVQFQLEAASGRAVRKMLPLVLARENNIRQAAVNAYVRLLAPAGLETIDEKESAMGVATGLAALGIGATTGELACLEALIGAMFKSQDTCKVISSSVIVVLWDIFAGRVPGASEEQRRSACILVGMVAADRPDSLQQRVHIIESVGLTDPSFARWSCVALCKLPAGSDNDGRLSQQLAEIVMSSKDLSAIEQALNAIFVLSCEPEATVGSIIRHLAEKLHKEPSEVPVSDLSRFLQVIGHVAVKELVRIEGLVSQVRRSIANQARNDGNHEEEEQAGAEADKALQLAEKELVSPASLLGRYGKLARKIASDRSAPPELQASSVLCMAKLMCVQETFCENNLRLLFSILSSAKEPLVRSNAVTALGDLAFRFPNMVEPWNSHIYAALQDRDDTVRKNTLMALTHLILNDMVKVKGQIVGLAVCILDKNGRIADLARLFFHELARKSANAIYNILPDTISCMSHMEDLKSEDFKTVVAFLVGLMDKEKHADGMVEKLCHRFRTNESDRENRDLAYCISQLNISERGVKKMNDNFKSFSAAICDETVHGYIMQAVNKGNKGGTNGQPSQTVEELTTKVNAIRQAAAEAQANEETHALEPNTSAVKDVDPTPRRSSHRLSSMTTPRKKIVDEDGDGEGNDENVDEDYEENVDEDYDEQASRRSSRRKSKKKRNKKSVEEESDDRRHEDSSGEVVDENESLRSSRRESTMEKGKKKIAVKEAGVQLAEEQQLSRKTGHRISSRRRVKKKKTIAESDDEGDEEAGVEFFDEEDRTSDVDNTAEPEAVKKVTHRREAQKRVVVDDDDSEEDDGSETGHAEVDAKSVDEGKSDDSSDYEDCA